MNIRAPAVAGRFYPSSAIELTQQVASFFQAEPTLSVQPKAVIVPHAGYYYSGNIAAQAYALLANRTPTYRRVVLLGPSHHVALNCCALPDVDAFETPLGNVLLDTASCQHLLDNGLVQQANQVHQWEHSLEVQLPLLQYCLGEFLLLPIVVGDSSVGHVSRLIAALSSLSDSLVVLSTDLSHYHQLAEAKRIDQQTCAQILALDSQIQGEQACGCHALNGLLHFADQQNWHIELVAQTNSGEVVANYSHTEADPLTEVVGYASFVLY
jgi:MEMO1 family protein